MSTLPARRAGRASPSPRKETALRRSRTPQVWRRSQTPCPSPGLYARLDTSMFVRYGGRDEIIPRAPIRRFVDGLPAEPMRRRKLAWDENGYHRLLRDLQAPVVIADVASWVLTPAAPLPSGADRTAAEAFLPADGRLS